MPRPQRILYENAYYHVMNRGARRQIIFFDTTERNIFLQILEEAHQRFHIEIHAYCLMDNHYHLLIKTPEANLSRAMQYIDAVYTQRHNYRNQLDGALFRGRYKAIIIDSDVYLLHLTKYIHLNPITAGMVEHLNDYPWSSYLAYIDKVSRPKYLFREEVYAQVTQNKNQFLAYEYFMADKDLNKALTQFYSQSSQLFVLGSDAFLNRLVQMKKPKQVRQPAPRYITINAIIKVVSEAFNQEPESFLKMRKGRQKLNLPRKLSIYIARIYGDYHLQELADIFGFTHVGGVSHAIHIFKQELKENPALEKCIESILKNEKHLRPHE